MDDPLPDWATRVLRRGYYSCITYIDDLIGQILQHLEDLGLAKDTVLAFVGDHGYHLGEHSIVGKNTAFEVANNVPMIIHIPAVTNNRALGVSDRLVELVDLFPTLVELAGFPPLTKCPAGYKESKGVNLCTEGTSLLPLFRDPTALKTEWKDRIFYQYPHYQMHNAEFRCCMGYSMRNVLFRYTEWVQCARGCAHGTCIPNWSLMCGVELYIINDDPHETHNMADDLTLAEVRGQLSRQLRAGWSEAHVSHK